nr:MAG TPA: hypothetical protein [Caudoviricetes sp.]
MFFIKGPLSNKKEDLKVNRMQKNDAYRPFAWRKTSKLADYSISI